MKAINNIRAKIPFPKKPSLTSEEILKLESSLQQTLIPVTPRQEFVERLNRQLIKSAPLARSQSVAITKEQKNRDNLLIGAASLIGAIAIFAYGFRIAITILGAIGILVQWANRKSSDKQLSLQNSI